jgi:hypothetical protein
MFTRGKIWPRYEADTKEIGRRTGITQVYVRYKLGMASLVPEIK